MVGGDDGDPALWLRHTRGEAIMSLPPFLFTLPKVEGGRIVVIGTGSPSKEATEGNALLRRRDVPPPTQCKIVNLFEEEDLLSEAPWRVSSSEESLMGITSRSTRGCWIKPPESLPPIPMVEWEIKDTIKRKNTSRMKKTNKERGRSQRLQRSFGREEAEIQKWRWSKTKCTLHLKWRCNPSVTGRSWNDAQKFCTTMELHSPTYRVSSTCPFHEWHVCKSNARAQHSPVAKGKTRTFSFNAFSKS